MLNKNMIVAVFGIGVKNVNMNGAVKMRKTNPKKRNDKDIKKARERYRTELKELRENTGIDIPFGANLDLYRSNDA